jgi:hypothetical protein
MLVALGTGKIIEIICDYQYQHRYHVFFTNQVILKA